MNPADPITVEEIARKIAPDAFKQADDFDRNPPTDVDDPRLFGDWMDEGERASKIATEILALINARAGSQEGVDLPAPNPEWEAKAKAYNDQARSERGPITREDAEQTLTMLRTWTADAQPANEQGQVSFARAMLESAEEALAWGLFSTPSDVEPQQPIPMILHCPSCGLKHIDRASGTWAKLPHRSHLCEGCGSVWRPADVPTVGVEAIKTAGKFDRIWPQQPKADVEAVGHLKWTRFKDRKPRKGDHDELNGEEHLLTWNTRAATYDHACLDSNWRWGEEIEGHPDDLWAWLPTNPEVSAPAQQEDGE